MEKRLRMGGDKDEDGEVRGKCEYEDDDGRLTWLISLDQVSISRVLKLCKDCP